MSGVVLDMPAGPSRPWFVRVLWRVMLGYVVAAVWLAVLYLLLYRLGFPPGPPVRPGPFPLDGAWSLGADLVVAAMIVLVAAWWIRGLIAELVRAPVSFGVVALAVAVTGYAPFLAFRPAPLVVIITWPVTTWIVQRYAIGRTLPFPKPSRRVWIALALAGVVVFGSYRVYHPLFGGDEGDGSIYLRNGWADLTITRVKGGYIGSGWPDPHQILPYTVHARSHVVVWSTSHSCNGVVKLTFSVLGQTATQSFNVSDAQSVACGGF